jgi:spermidine synthase
MPSEGRYFLLFVSIFLISAAALAYEILLMRLLSIIQWHHFAYMIISLALLGYGVSGTFLALTRRWLQERFAAVYIASAVLFGVSMVVCFALAQRVPFNALEVMWDPTQYIHLLLIYLLLFVPFFFAASCIGLAFIQYKERISRIYLSDLLGAGTGALGIILLLFVLRPETSVQVLVGLALLAAVVANLCYYSQLPRWPLPTIIACVVVLLFGFSQSWLGLHISPYKGLEQSLQVMGTRILSEQSNPLGLLTVVESPTIPFRYAPGLSLNTKHEPPRQLAVFTDGDGLSVITRYHGRREQLAYLDDMSTALPYHMLRRPRVLILGAGGGSDVLLALYHQAETIEAVELNPLVVDLVKNRHADYAGHLYDAPGVRIDVAEARGYVTRSAKRYDLIHVALLDSFGATNAGVHALSESYIYTVEALQAYLDHLAPNGLLAITRWLKLPPRDSLKLFGTAVEALKRTGVAAPERHLALIRSWNTSTLLVKNGHLTESDVVAIRNFCERRSFDVAYYPGMERSEANQFNLLDEAYLFDGATALLSGARPDFLDRYKFHITPATDDKPHFFHFFKWRSLPELLALPHGGRGSLVEWGYLILVTTIVQALVVGIALILVPLWVTKHMRRRRTGVRMGFYFGALGLAFIFMEIAFIQKFILFLNHPLYAIAVVLSGFLVFAGLGSGYSGQLARRLQNTAFPPIAAAAAGIVVISLIYIVLLPEVSSRLVALPDAAKITASLGLIAPLAFCMGMPFPLGLAKLAAHDPDFIPWAWGINGFASVVSAALATLLAIHFGFTAVVVLALVLYVLAAVLVRRPL